MFDTTAGVFKIHSGSNSFLCREPITKKENTANGA
jgi:hypothetical protein